MKFRYAIPFILLPTTAFAQFVPNPVTPSVCTVSSVATGGTAITAFTGPANGFILGAGSTAITWSLTGAAGSAASGGTAALIANQWIYWGTQLQSGVSLSVNAASTTAFTCFRW